MTTYLALLRTSSLPSSFLPSFSVLTILCVLIDAGRLNRSHPRLQLAVGALLHSVAPVGYCLTQSTTSYVYDLSYVYGVIS